MTRKDSEKEAERPHYYSQFWLDVAAGRRVIGTPKTEDGADQAESETPVPEPTPLRKAGRNSTATVADGYRETHLPSVAEPAVEPEEDYVEPEQDEVELPDTVDDLELPTLDADETFEDAEISDLDLNPEEEEEESEDEDYFDDEEEEEEEDEDGWAARGRKKPKPGRPVKQPKVVKKPKRDRRGF
jgi:hypothetical protein